METFGTVYQFKQKKRRLKWFKTEALRLSCHADISKCKLSNIALSAGEEREMDGETERNGEKLERRSE